ncbi:hypothetical protein J422_05369 [Methanocaldococcus villosus KIN24-T80]|uniref:Uncharacterized protein n=1 Tax=Methanocaldococcus villosus KIN24-T80 TaxID=1069083 RepID=N6V0R8_9EURY|nr:DUF2097 family protein [Methanocaldococcus villosus]ENN95908.1 hypothetical protein J422_05369 [Methanocaldococcus villosus KIN24-T80]
MRIKLKPNEIFNYLNNIEEGDYIELYYGRVHIEGEFIEYYEGILKVLNKSFGIIELDVEEILEDILELAHTNKDGRKVIEFY